MKTQNLGNLTRLVVVVLLTTVLLFGVLPAFAHGPADPGDNVSTKDLIRPFAAARSWTAAEMEAAIPLPYPTRDGSAPQGLTAQGGVPTGPAGFTPSVAPAGAQLYAAPMPAAATAGAAAGFGYPPPFDRYQPYVQPRYLFPLKAVGRLFFESGGVKYSCSAASVGNYAIWTAGHCVHSGDGSSEGWAQRMVFVPAYHDGRAPYGQWAMATLWTRREWYESGDFRHDMGGAVLKKLNGNKISKVVGALGFAWNQPLAVHWHAVGYPAGAPFNGKRQFTCLASYAASDSSMGDPAPSGIGCDLTPGVSGGSWIQTFKPNTAGGANFVNGNYSYGYLDEPLQIYSPYYDDNAKGLYDALTGDAP